MKKDEEIHGLRFLCRDTVEIVPGDGAPILVHSSLEEERSDFEFLFGSLLDQWRDGFIVNSFFRTFSRDGVLQDPAEELAISYDDPGAIYRYDAESGLVLLHGRSFPRWAPYCGGYWWQLLVLDDVLPFEELSRCYFGGAKELGEKAWPRQLVCVFAEWDDTFWQFFTRDVSLIEQLKQVHRQDPRILMLDADIRTEYPHPSDKELLEAD